MISNVDFSGDELIKAIRYDCVAFFGFYLGEDLTMEVPELHEDIWNELLKMVETANHQGIQYALRKLFAVPRDHAKSTIAKLAVILFLKYTDLKFALYVSKTNGHAKNAIRDIIQWITSPQEAMLFGPAKIIKSSETESLWILDIPLKDRYNDSPRFKRVIFKALGADQQVRGLNINNTRPQIVVIDDIEDLDNTTEDQQPKLDEWFMGPLLKSFDSSRNICIFIGNMIRKTTLLARLAKERDWNPTVYGALVRDKETGELKSLWEGRHPLEKLLKEYAYFRRMGTGHMWEAEMMNLTQDEILIKDFENAIRPPAPQPEQVTCGIIILDPAFGKNAWNDDSAFSVHVRIQGISVPVVVETFKARLNEEEVFDKLLELSYKWGLTTWGIESDAAQKLLIPLFNLYIRDRKMNENLFSILPLRSGGTAKASRILAFRTSYGSGSYGIVDSEFDLVDRLSRYDPNSTDHDDLCDSAAYGTIAWQFHDTVITQNGIKQVPMLAFLRDQTVSMYQSESDICAF